MYRSTAVMALAAAANAAAVSTADNCSTRTVCADYVNDCGIWYGGCFADCKPWPTFTPPPCPSTSSSVGLVTPTSSQQPSSKPCGGEVACVTSYRDCSTTQLPFGGCYPACSPQPLYTPPPCPQATASSRPAYPITTVLPPVTTVKPPVATLVPPTTTTTSS